MEVLNINNKIAQQKIANKKYYEANKAEKIKKVLNRYNDLKTDEAFKLKRKEYMKEYYKRRQE
jgi:hypothetical protein